ncbi:hypothetical protein TNCT_609141 [Trichonephila clavata]|uniref:Uncharacterized protein n=1 Tax=Trichonephila clavata TaxID=2740835 RepID=A0A8X6FX64_TRICU|nr:hypothetical protein TNCT_609141 [Trichonephila clavata]
MRETVDADLGIMELKQKLMLTEEEARLKAEKEAKILEARWRIEKEARLMAEEEARLKAQEDAKAVEERRKAQEERKMNERIALCVCVWKKRRDWRKKDGLCKSRCNRFKKNTK